MPKGLLGCNPSGVQSRSHLQLPAEVSSPTEPVLELLNPLGLAINIQSTEEALSWEKHHKRVPQPRAWCFSLQHPTVVAAIGGTEFVDMWLK